MAEYSNLILTDLGKVVLAKAIAGKPLKFSRVSCGDGFLEEYQEICELEGLINPLYDLEIFSCEVGYTADDKIIPGMAELRAMLDNKEIEEGFYVREIGVFALDPDTEEEVLYGYSNSGDKSDYMPAYGGKNIVEFLYKLCMVIDNAQDVTAVSASGIVYVSQSEFNAMFGDSKAIEEFWTRAEWDERKFRPVGVPETRVTIMGIEDMSIIQDQINKVAEANTQNAITFFKLFEKIKSSVITKHKDLEGLLGGDPAHNQYFHLTVEEWNNVRGLKDAVKHGTNRISHEKLLDLQGGDESSHYHLTQVQLDKLNGIPATGIKGDKGDKGDPGTAATISVGTVITGAAGSSASVTNVGTSSAAKFNFVIPKGDTGATGATGPQGPKGDKGDKGDAGNDASVVIIDNLETQSGVRALSARQGYKIGLRLTELESAKATYDLLRESYDSSLSELRIKIQELEDAKVMSDLFRESIDERLNAVQGPVIAVKGKRQITDNGYVYLLNGVIIQWGRDMRLSPREETRSCTFPIVFPTSCLHVVLTTATNIQDGITTNDVFAQLSKNSITRTGFDYFLQFTDSSTSASYGGQVGIYYIAIGY